MDQSTEAKPGGAQRRGWMRFSVRRLFLVITLVCVLGGVAMVVANRIAAEIERVDRTNDLLWRVDKQVWEAAPPHFSIRRVGDKDESGFVAHQSLHRRLYRARLVHLEIESNGAKMSPAELCSHLREYYAEQIGHGIGGAIYSTSNHQLPNGLYVTTAALSTQDADLLLIDALVDVTQHEATVRIMVVVASD